MQHRSTHARKEYEQGSLDEASVASDPVSQFALWYDAAVAADVPEPEAMTLSTATPEGRPSARIVLLRGFEPSKRLSHRRLEFATEPRDRWP